jgi:HD-GYP domain-containing protein (c-di-GMP phosphodiesterase class II)
MKKQTQVLQMIAHLNGAVSNSRLYASDHPQVALHMERAYGELRALLAIKKELTFIIVDSDLILDNQVMTPMTPQLEQFVHVFRKCAIQRVTFTEEVTLEALSRLVSELSSLNQEVVHSSKGIRLGKVLVGPGGKASSSDPVSAPELEQRLEDFGNFRNLSLDNLKDLYHQIKTTKKISPHGLGEIVQGFLHGMMRNVNPLQMLASLKTSDEYTFTHAINVCLLTMAQAEALGVKGKPLYEIGIAASMHDAGKMFVPDEILNKPDKLTAKEWDHMRNHAMHGAHYILKLEGIPRLAFLAALEHHIHFDGTGYPDMGKHWRPNIVSQMVTIADFFDAMRSRRAYKEPKPDAVIIKILKEESGTTFNPDLVDNFLRLIRSD